jgi:nucleoside-diphosphate-sugar epimerase
MGNETVLITGATGFVGSRLVERLVLGTDYKVKAMVRRFSGAGLARLARLPVELVLADLLDLDALTEAAKNCDIIVHCAYGNSGDAEQRKEVTISGTENVLKAALQAKVWKVIYLSSSAVHGRDPKSPVVDESAPFGDDGDVYSVSKIEAEKIVWRYHQEHGLPVVVFRPTLIYGPYGRVWTVRIVREIQSGAILVNGGSGAANLIYIDNLVDAILLAMRKNLGDGEAFILVDDERLTWQDVYQRYAEMMSAYPPLQSMSAKEIEVMRKTGQPSVFNQWIVVPWRVALELVQYTFRPPEMRRKIGQIPWVRFITKLVPRQIKNRLRGEGKSRESALAGATQPGHIQLPPKDMVELYASQSRFSNEKVKRILGYAQRIPFDEAIDLTRSWLQYQRLIP